MRHCAKNTIRSGPNQYKRSTKPPWYAVRWNDTTVNERGCNMLTMHDSIEALYIEYINNFLTVEAFAEYYGYSVAFATALIAEGKRFNDLRK
jgi:hypothetical protein